MASSLLFRHVDKMKQRLSEGLSCSSAASTSVAAAAFVSSGRAIDRHSPHPAAHITRRRLSTTSSAQPPPVPRSPGSSPSSPSLSSSKLKKKKKTQQQAPSPASSSRFLLNSSRLQLNSDADDGIVAVLDSLPPPSFIDDHLCIPGAGGDRESTVQSTATAETSSSSASASWSSSASTSSSGAAPVAAKKKDDDDRRKNEMAMTRSCSTTRQHQVVVLRVSLHCKGCAGKVKKHISKMEGVTSFEIDIATKKVTVTGDVTPLGVLNSISKVKAAQFWPTASPSSSSSSSSQQYYSSPPRASASF